MPADASDRLTRSLKDRYRVDRVLGEGGMATVYLAYDLKHQRQVAIKVLKPEIAAAVGADRFLREITIAAKLNYPHIVPLFDSGEADGLVFYVMPFIAGESLRDRLRREKQLPVEEAVSIARQVAAALTYAAGLGIIHRDIKPDNVLLIDGTAMVADFGIARAIVESGSERLTATGGAIGTPAYMSPEQASGARDLDARSDVYALGCVVYEALAGEPPYTGPTVQSIIAQHLASPVPPVRRLRDLVPESVEHAITRALAKLPADRFANAQDFATALSTPIDERFGYLTPPSALAPARKSRAPLGMGLAALAGLAVLLLLVFNVGGVRDRLTGGRASASVADGRRSLAVLPFQNVGAADEEYFSDGLTEELIVALSQLRSLRVAARTSAFAFKGQARDVREIARALSVASVLVGSVRKTENRVRVTAQLVDGASGLDVWSETYEERNLSDIFDIQADIATKIAGALEANLGASERARLAHKPTENLEAYTLYLKGLYFWNRRGERLTRALEYFHRAIAVDSQYARAYAGIASTFAPLGIHGHVHPDSARVQLRQAALRAIALDSNLAEGHTALAAYYHFYEWDWPAAEREFKRAIELDPSFTTAHLWYGYSLEARRRFPEAIAERSRARELDPLSAVAAGGVGGAIVAAHGDYERAKSLYRESIELDPNFWQAYDSFGTLLEVTGDLSEARRMFEVAVQNAGHTQKPKAGLARVLARAHKMTEARKLLAELRADGAATGIRHPVVASALYSAGDSAGAFEWLEAAYRQRHPDLMRIGADRGYDVLREDPRFQELVRRVGLRPAANAP
jgi:TolB-like protein/Tfp pilus assembly protein PilF/tRNA A-37 threonylcarbamoyl transferase component Bud32